MYFPTINLDDDTLNKLRTGEIKLKCGQWITIRGDSKKSRWVGTRKNSGTLWAAHYSWQKGAQQDQFQAMAKIRRQAPNDFI